MKFIALTLIALLAFGCATRYRKQVFKVESPRTIKNT